MLEAGQQALGMGIKAIDDRIAEKLPSGWQVGMDGKIHVFCSCSRRKYGIF
jgi:hypothetical protein